MRRAGKTKNRLSIATRRIGWVARGLVMLWLSLWAAQAMAQDVRYLRVGTNPAGETHFVMGGLISSAISSPPGSPPCEKGGSCGVPGLIAVAIATSGNIATAQSIGEGRLDMGLVQADIAALALAGKPPFAKPLSDLRAVGRLYADQIHLVARRGANIRSPRDLRGKRVALGAKGSGTLVHAAAVLDAWGVKLADVRPQYLRSAQAVDAMAAGRLDAFFVIDAAPVPNIAELFRFYPITLVPLTGDGVDRLQKDNPLLKVTEIPAGAYDGLSGPVATLSVPVDLVASAKLPDDLIYKVTAALWHPAAVKQLSDGHPAGAHLSQGRAAQDTAVPLHPGAARFYQDGGR